MANGPRLLTPPVALVPRDSLEAANVGFWDLRPSARAFFLASVIGSVLATPIMLVGQHAHAALPILLGLFVGGWLLRTLTLVRVQRFAYSYHGAVCAALTIQGFPDAALAVACGAVASDSWVYRDRLVDAGVLICGSGAGVSIAANKIRGVRAALCHDPFTARQSREDDDANVLCLGTAVVSLDSAIALARTFLAARFSHAERHARRLAKVLALEASDLGESVARRS